MAIIYNTQNSISNNMCYPCYKRLKTEYFHWTELTIIESETFNLIFLFSAASLSMRDLSSPTKDRTRAPCSGSVQS